MNTSNHLCIANASPVVMVLRQLNAARQDIVLRTRNRKDHSTDAEVESSPHLRTETYAKEDRLQAEYSNRVLDVFQPTFRVGNNERPQYLDVGCGPGDFTRDGLLPRCLPGVRLVGVDCSADMVEYAKKHSAHENLKFVQLDIGGDVTQFVREYGTFDRVYSFFCLHWLEDQQAALKNIATLLKPGGECLIVSCASHQGTTVWRHLAAMDRWAKYSERLLRFVPRTEGMSDVGQIHCMTKWMEEAGLVPSSLEMSCASCFDNGTTEDSIAMHLSVVPIINSVSEEEKPQLVADVTEMARIIHAPNADQSSYKMFIIKASKISSS